MQGLIAGIDIGSRSIELVVLNEDKVVYQVIAPTTFDARAQCKKLIAGLEVEKIVATGYGRKLFAETFDYEEVDVITEIQAYTLGTRKLFPEARTILDIGGQDTKVIALSPEGKTTRFEMNDRCAAGTGKFLEFMANALQIPIGTFGSFALGSDRRIEISSMCTVFAETEAVSLMARGEKPENIALGLHLGIVRRTLAMIQRVGDGPPLVFAGGVAHNPCVRKLLEKELNYPIIVPEQPDFMGALGAALYGIN